MNKIIKNSIVLVIVIIATIMCLIFPVPMGFLYGGPMFIMGGIIHSNL